jgi:transposase
MVREFVDGQDLRELGFKTATVEQGRPRYSANLLLKVWLYGYMTKNRSSRGLERACLDQMGMLWLAGMKNPDHTTLWRFWRDNQQAIGKLFKQLLQIATSLNLIGLVLHALDGTKIQSEASEQKGLHRPSLEKTRSGLDEAIAQILKQTEQEAAEPQGECRLPESLQKKQELRARIQAKLEELHQSERDHLNPGDEDARMMKCRNTKQFAYNAQAVVDQQSHLIVAADVVCDESDNYQLVPMLDQVQQNIGSVAEQTAADAGYKAITGLAEAEEKGFPVLVNLAEPEDAPYHASRFLYDADNDQCICPRGQVLKYESSRTREKVKSYTVRVYRCANYENCPVRWQCSSSKTGRTIQIHQNHAALLRQREKLKDERMRLLLRQRSTTVEPVFGWAKQVFGFRRWTVRGLEKVRTQWRLLCIALNLTRLYRSWRTGRLRFA